MWRIATALALTGVLLPSGDLHSQQREIASGMARNARASLHSSSGSSEIALYLRQGTDAVSFALLAVIADSLVAVAVDSTEEPEVQAAAVHALGLAALNGSSGGRFTGSLERLVRIASERSAVSGLALAYFDDVTTRQEAVSLLMSFAARDDGIAFTAVHHLAEFSGSEGQVALRNMLRGGAIKNQRATDEARRVGRLRGWVRDP